MLPVDSAAVTSFVSAHVLPNPLELFYKFDRNSFVT
jgi:hypothetical protein